MRDIVDAKSYDRTKRRKRFSRKMIGKVDNPCDGMVSFGYKPKRKGKKMTEVNGTARIVNAAYVAKFAAKLHTPKVATRTTKTDAMTLEFLMESNAMMNLSN